MVQRLMCSFAMLEAMGSMLIFAHPVNGKTNLLSKFWLIMRVAEFESLTRVS